MRGAVLYAPGDVRIAQRRDDPTIVEPTDAIIRLVCDLCLRIRPVAVPRSGACRRTSPNGTRIRRHRRRSRERGQDAITARPVRDRIVLRVRQHLRDLPGRLPDRLHPPRAHGLHRHTGRMGSGFHSLTAPWSQLPNSHPPNSSPTCLRPPMCSALAGSEPLPPTPAPARPSPSSVTAP